MRRCEVTAYWARAAALALVMALTASAGAFSADGPGDGGKAKKAERFLINDQWIEGTIVEKNDRGFKLRMDVGGVVTDVELLWSALSAHDLKRIRGEEGPSPLEKLMAQGADLVAATRFRFKNGRVRVGLMVKEKSTDAEIVIRTKYAREFHFLDKEVESREPVMLPETEFYSLDEIYQRKKAELNPQEDAGRHFKLAQYMLKIRHWAKAEDHFERARLLDERFNEAAGQKIEGLKASRIEAQVLHLDQLITTDIRAERWIGASRRIRTLSALDPNSFIRTKWEAQLPEIEENIRKTLRRSVVRSYYKHMEDFLRKWVWGRVPDGGAIPGVIVVMRQGEAVRGKLVSDDEEFVVVENQGRIIKIAKNMVSRVSDVDLNPRRRVPGYGDSKKYVEDETGGITAGIVTALLEEYKEYSTPQLAIDQEVIEGFWKDRLTSVVVITREGRKQTVPVCVLHEATYGTGTWLREGTPTTSTGGQSRDGRRGGGGGRGRNGPGGGGAAGAE